MAPPIERLKRRTDFVRATRARNSAPTPGLILQARRRTPGERAGRPADPRPAGDAVRVGFTASRKVGNAVLRNRAKRRLRALADDILASRATPGVDYVLIARAATPARDFSRLRRDLLSALKRLGLDRQTQAETPPAGGRKRDTLDRAERG